MPFDAIYENGVFLLKHGSCNPLGPACSQLDGCSAKQKSKVVAGAPEQKTMRNVVLAGFHMLTFGFAPSFDKYLGKDTELISALHFLSSTHIKNPPLIFRYK